METMKDIKARFASAKEGEYNALFRHYENDERSGVQKLIQQYHKKLQALEDERVRTESMKKYEHEYEHLGYLCGIDEVINVYKRFRTDMTEWCVFWDQKL